MMCYSLDIALESIESKFENFFDNITEDLSRSEFLPNRYIVDQRTGMVDMHLFPKNLTIQEGKNKHREIMIRRSNRLDSHIKLSNSILFVSNRIDPVEEFDKFSLGVNKIYSNKKIYNINIRDSDRHCKQVYEFDRNRLLIEYQFEDTYKGESESESWIGNINEWGGVLKTVLLSNLFANCHE
jgi:hypothetical protein